MHADVIDGTVAISSGSSLSKVHRCTTRAQKLTAHTRPGNRAGNA
jgi:hypothetical protein